MAESIKDNVRKSSIKQKSVNKSSGIFNKSVASSSGVKNNTKESVILETRLGQSEYDENTLEDSKVITSIVPNNIRVVCRVNHIKVLTNSW